MSITLKYKTVKIKKPRLCWGCGFTSDIGKSMNYIVSICEGDFGTSYWCEVCEEYLKASKGEFEHGVAQFEFRFEADYNNFKNKYLCQQRQVIIEKNIQKNGTKHH